MCPAPEQVNLDQVGLAGEDLCLLGQVFLAAGIAHGLVGRADDFDRGNQSIVRSVSPVDLAEWLLVRVVLDHLNRDNHGLGQIDFLGDRDASMYLSPTGSAQSRLLPGPRERSTATGRTGKHHIDSSTDQAGGWSRAFTHSSCSGRSGGMIRSSP